MCENEVTTEMLDAGFEALEGELPERYNWNVVRESIKQAYLAMERERVFREALESLVEDAEARASLS